MPKPEFYNLNTDYVVGDPVLAKNPDARLQLLEVNAGGELKVAVSGAGSGGTSMVDDAAFTPGSSGVTPAAGYYLAARDTLNDGDAGAVAVTQKRALLACLETPTGDSVMDDTNDAVRVNLVAGAGSGGTASTFGAAIPASGTAAGFSDGTNMQAARTFDADSGAGTENVLGVVLRKVASGGSVELGTLTNPVRVDPTGTTAQDVDVLTVPADPFGANADAAATAGSTGSIQAKLRLMTSQLDAIKTAVELSDNAISGSEMQVDVVASLPAGTNNIGDVDVVTVPADPFGTNADAAATAGSTGTMQAKFRLMTSQLDAVKTAVELLDNTVSGSELQVDVVAALPVGDNNIGNVDVVTVPADPFGANADAAATAGSTGSIQAKLRLMTSQLDSIKTAVETLDNTVAGSETQVDVVAALPAGTNTIGSVEMVPSTSGGFDTYHLVSAATTNAAVVKASAGQLYGWYIYNSNAAARKVTFHNTASTPTAGASVFFSIMIPPTSAANILGAIGIAFSSGIAITTVTGIADSNSTAVAADDLLINLFYK